MSVCRVCLSKNPRKHMSQLRVPESEDQQECGYQHIIMFCLGIKVIDYPTMNNKLCGQCFKKVEDFYQFKLMAIKSYNYLKAHQALTTQNEVFLHQEVKSDLDIIKTDDSSININKDESPPTPIISIGNDFDTEVPAIKVECINQLQSVEPGSEPDNDYSAEDPIELNVQSPDNIDIRIYQDTNMGNWSINKKFKQVNKKKEQFTNMKGKVLLRNIRKHKKIGEDVMSQFKSLSGGFQCVHCTKHFKDRDSVIAHINGYLLEKKIFNRLQCPLCFKYVRDLRLHTKTVHDNWNQPYACEQCSRRFTSASRLKTHASVHTNERPYACDLCPKKFRLKPCLYQHKRQVHLKQKTFECNTCLMSFLRRYQLNKHLKLHSEGILKGKTKNKWKCRDCKTSYTTWILLRQHMLSHRVRDSVVSSDFDSVNEETLPIKIECKDEQKSQKSDSDNDTVQYDEEPTELRDLNGIDKAEYEMELDSKNINYEFIQETPMENTSTNNQNEPAIKKKIMLPKKKKNKPSAKKNIESPIKINKESSSSIKKKRYKKPLKVETKSKPIQFSVFECDHCGRKFDKKFRISQHMGRCHKLTCQCKIKIPISIFENKAGRAKCSQCGKLYGTYMKRRSKIVDYIAVQCEICSKFVKNLSLHKRVVHANSNLPVGCDKCPLRFTNQYRLTVHSSVHSQDRPFACDLCPKKFRLKPCLLQHKSQVHLRHRTYLCDICPKQFFKRNQLLQHKRTHSGNEKAKKDKILTCSECGKEYACIRSLRKHVFSHGIKLICEVCSSSFDNYGRYISHRATHTECRVCGKNFMNARSRRRHEKVICKMGSIKE